MQLVLVLLGTVQSHAVYHTLLISCRLGTYIDVLQIHRLDRDTPPEEIMRALNDVIDSGKVRYIGASSMAAWELQMLNNVAEKHGWHKFIRLVIDQNPNHSPCR